MFALVVFSETILQPIFASAEAYNIFDLLSLKEKGAGEKKNHAGILAFVFKTIHLFLSFSFPLPHSIVLDPM